MKKDDPKDDCCKCMDNEKEMKRLRKTVESIKNASNTIAINNMVNLKNIIGTSIA